jgi:hypothetical protein
MTSRAQCAVSVAHVSFAEGSFRPTLVIRLNSRSDNEIHEQTSTANLWIERPAIEAQSVQAAGGIASTRALCHATQIFELISMDDRHSTQTTQKTLSYNSGAPSYLLSSSLVSNQEIRSRYKQCSVGGKSSGASSVLMCISTISRSPQAVPELTSQVSDVPHFPQNALNLPGEDS